VTIPPSTSISCADPPGWILNPIAESVVITPLARDFPVSAECLDAAMNDQATDGLASAIDGEDAAAEGQTPETINGRVVENGSPVEGGIKANASDLIVSCELQTINPG